MMATALPRKGRTESPGARQGRKMSLLKVKNVEEFTDHSPRETKQEHIDPKSS